MRVPDLYERMYDRSVFTTQDAADAAGVHGSTLHEMLSRLTAQGYFQRVRRGLYAVVPVDQRGQDPVVNPHVVASKLVEPYVLGYHTALEVHGAAHSAFHQVFVATPATFRPFAHQGVTYRRVRAAHKEVEASRVRVVVEDHDIHVANREWALVQCARRLDLCGGLEELLRSVDAYPSLRFDHVADALEMLGFTTLYNRVGFVLSRNRRRWRLTDGELDRLRSRTSGRRVCFGVDPSDGRPRADRVLVPEWNVVVPRHLAGGDAVGADA